MGNSLGDCKASDMTERIYRISDESTGNFYKWVNSNSNIINKISDKYKI
ncbi:hypothetical protein [Clostridioides difficile]|nr:hypothetical protein [Clostridioides difficile]